MKPRDKTFARVFEVITNW